MLLQFDRTHQDVVGVSKDTLLMRQFLERLGTMEEVVSQAVDDNQCGRCRLVWCCLVACQDLLHKDRTAFAADLKPQASEATSEFSPFDISTTKVGQLSSE